MQRMIVTCSNCNKEYKIDPLKLRGKTVRTRCRACKTPMTIASPIKVVAPLQGKPDAGSELQSDPTKPSPPQGVWGRKKIPGRTTAAALPSIQQTAGQKVRLGLTIKLVFLLILPVVAVYLGNAYLSFRQMVNTQKLTIAESREMCHRMGEKLITEHARAIAESVELYLKGHPNTAQPDYVRDIDFRRITVRKIGLTGTSFLLRAPEDDGVWRVLVHPDPAKLGALKKLEGGSEPYDSEFRRIITQSGKGVESQGYFVSIDRDGLNHRVFMVCTPVEGSPLAAASAARIDEFAMPVERMQKRIEKLNGDLRRTQAALMGLGLVTIVLIIALYGRSIKGRLKHLHLFVRRIGMGDLDAEVGKMPRDEIGALGRALEHLHKALHDYLTGRGETRKRA
jgi:HAMP domain-containing protein